VVERHADVGPLRPAVDDHCPQGLEPERQFRAEREDGGERVALIEAGADGQEQERLVRGRAAGAVDVQLGEPGEPLVAGDHLVILRDADEGGVGGGGAPSTSW
jgi:hypothetical protein